MKQFFWKNRYWLLVVLILLILLIHFATRPRAVTAYYVAKDGLDTNTGSSESPFLTIQKAASLAQSGQSVIIRSGTYRETVTPVSNGVNFQPDAGAAVVVSGLEQVRSAWTQHAGNIYKATVTLPVQGFNQNLTTNTTILANQVFKDGVMQFQARYPNISQLGDMIDRAKYRHFSQATIGRSSTTDNGFPAGNFTNGNIWVTGWFISESRKITGHNGKTISYGNLNESSKFQRWFYITNDLELLDVAKEWHYENGTLYFFQEGGGPPTGVEYKARNWGFDLRGKDNTKIIGIHFIGCEVATGDEQTDGTVIDNVRAKYTNHAFNTTTGGDFNYFNAKQTGLKLIGNNNTVQNSEFQYVSSQVIWLGNGGRAENNLCTDIGWEGNYGAFVSPWGTSAGNIKILRNTAYNLGRSAVDFGHGSHPNIEIAYNYFHTFSKVTSDVGVIYGCCGVNLVGGIIHHNWLAGNMVGQDWRKKYNNVDWYDGIHVNLYFDQGAGPMKAYYNVMWDGAVADFYSEIKNGVLTYLYNNVFATTAGRESYFCAHTGPADVQRNNIYRHEVNIAWNFVTSNDNASQPGDVDFSLFKVTDPLFVGTGDGGLKYRIQSSSPAKDKGTAIAGITEGNDIGAYEYGATDWLPGYDGTIKPEPPDPEPPDSIPPPDPEPPPTLKDTVPQIFIKKENRLKGIDIIYETVSRAKIEAETGNLYGASTQSGTYGVAVCCIQPGAVLGYGERTGTARLRIRYSRGNQGAGTMTLTAGGVSQKVTFDYTGDWTTFVEKVVEVKAGKGELSFNSGETGPANLDWFRFE